MKKLLTVGLILAALIGLHFKVDNVQAVGCLTSSQGGTGNCTATSSNVGQVLGVTGLFNLGNGTEAPIYGFVNASSSGGGSSSGTVFLLTAGNNLISLSPASITASGTISVNTSTLATFIGTLGYLTTSTNLTVANLATSSISQFANDAHYATSSGTVGPSTSTYVAVFSASGTITGYANLTFNSSTDIYTVDNIKSNPSTDLTLSGGANDEIDLSNGVSGYINLYPGISSGTYIWDPRGGISASLDTSLLTGQTNYQFPNSSGILCTTGTCVTTSTITLNGFTSSTFTATGTVNEIIVTQSPSGTLTFSTPQSIGTASFVQFGQLGIGTTPTSNAGLNIYRPGNQTGDDVYLGNPTDGTTGILGTESLVNTADTVYLFSAGSNQFIALGVNKANSVIISSSQLSTSLINHASSTLTDGNTTTTNLTIGTLGGLLYGTNGVVGTITTSSLGLPLSVTATGTLIAGGTATGPAITLATSSLPYFTLNCTGSTCTFTGVPTSTILAGYSTSTASGGVTTSSAGTINTLPIWTSASALGNSTISGTSTVTIAASTTNIGSATTTFQIFSNGHINSTGTVATVSSCGTNPSITGTDSAGTVTVGSVSATTCTVTFAAAYKNPPACTITGQTGTIALSYSISTTTIIVTNAALTSDKFNYTCFAQE